MKRLGVITPYQPGGGGNVERFFTEYGCTVVRLVGLKCESPVKIAHAPGSGLAQAVREVDGPDVDAVAHVGTNLAFPRLAGFAEAWIGGPVIAVNTAICWHALRSSGIQDRIDGWVLC